MKLFEADPARDKKFREEARRAFQKVEKQIKNDLKSGLMQKTIERSYDDYAGGGYGYIFDKLLNKYSDLDIMITDKNDANQSGRFSVKGKKDLTIVIPALDLKKPKNTINNFKGKYETFIHEFIHYLDLKRRKGLKYKKGKNFNYSGTSDLLRKKGKGAYYNEPKELNAYFQGGVAWLERFMKRLKSDNPSTYYAVKGLDANKFIEIMGPKALNKNWYEKLNKKNKRKIMVRLWQHWKEHIK